MTNQELIANFESGAISDDRFHHADHVHMAFAYLSQFSGLEALDRFSQALKRFAARAGKPQLYHETVTQAYFFLIRERMVRSECASWEEFIARNADLLTFKDGILNRYYLEATLKSEMARKMFVLPDRCV